MIKDWASDQVKIGNKKISIKYVFASSSIYPSVDKPDREFKGSDLSTEWNNFLAYLMREKTQVEKMNDPQIYDTLKRHIPKFWGSGKFKDSYPNFEFFKGTLRFVLGRSLQIFLTRTPQVVKGNNLSIQIKIVKTGREKNLLPKWDGALIGTLCDYERAFLEISGEHLMDMIVGPWFMVKMLKKDKEIELPTIIEHELQHQIGLKSVQFYDRVFDENWEEIASVSSKRYPQVPRRSGGVAMLIAAVYGIEAEALSMLRERKKLREIPIIPQYAQEFREKLEKLVEITDLKKAKKYFDDEVDIRDTDGAGTYYWTLVMSLTIALAIAKQQKRKLDIFLRYKRNRQVHFTKFSELLEKEKIFYIPKLPDDLFDMTVNYIYEQTYVAKDKKGKIVRGKGWNPMHPLLRFKKFIQIYENACRILGVRVRRMALTWSYFWDLYRHGRVLYKKTYKKLVEKSGFIYEDLGTPYY